MEENKRPEELQPEEANPPETQSEAVQHPENIHIEEAQPTEEQPEETKAEKKPDLKQTILIVVIVLAICAMLVSGGMLIYYTVIAPNQNKKVLDDYRSKVQTSSVPSASSATSSQPVESEEPQEEVYDTVLPQYEELLAQNKDFAGWIKIPGTSLDHPVFFTPFDQNYYLKRNPEGKDDRYGSLFLSQTSTLYPQAHIMVMYGHNMEDDDLMFGQLQYYLKKDFLQKQPTLTFDTIYREQEWKVIAVCYASTDYKPNNFCYAYTDYSTEEGFNDFLYKCRIRSMFQIEDDTTYDDSLLVLSTCMYRFWGERLVVVCRRVRPDEQVDLSTAKDNSVVLMPNEFYKYCKNNGIPSDQKIRDNYKAFYGEDEIYRSVNP